MEGGGMMLCPLKFARYEFEGGEECIGAECGFFGGVCMDATNGMRGETNGIADGITLPDGDAVAMLRKYANFWSLSHETYTQCDSNWEKTTMRTLADMVERDYVRRVAFEAKDAEVSDLRDERDRMQADYERIYQFQEVETERNLWKSNAERYKAECDELKSRHCPHYHVDRHYCDVHETRINELIAERDEWKRKIEILKAHGVEIADAVAGGFEVYNEAVRERDEWKAKVKTLADYSRYWRGRCAKLEYRSDKRAAAVERLRKMQYVDDYGDWVEAIAEVVKGTDKSNIGDCGMWESLIDLLTDDDGVARSNDGATNLEWLYEYDESFAYGAKRFVVDDGYSYCETLDQAHEWLMAPHEDTHSKAQSKMEPKLSEQPELLSDSREKLEAEILDAGCADEIDYDRIIGWLDRQVAITERKHLELACAFQLESDKRITELQTKVDELTAQLHASNAERERLRECLGIATDNAHDLLTLVDESGNVHDRDEGLA